MDFEQEEEVFDEKEAHKHFAVNLYNLTWDYLEKAGRSQADDEVMLNATHASAYHWLQVGTEVNFQRSFWQLARVYTVLGDKRWSLYYAQRCYELTTQHKLVDFDLAFSFEALARAYALNGMEKEYQQYRALAQKASEQIEEDDDKEIFLKDLNSGLWFGMA